MKHLCDVFSSWVTISRMKEPITLIYKFPRVTCPTEGWVVARPASIMPALGQVWETVLYMRKAVSQRNSSARPIEGSDVLAPRKGRPV